MSAVPGALPSPRAVRVHHSLKMSHEISTANREPTSLRT